jgi:hypothetical protein
VSSPPLDGRPGDWAEVSLVVLEPAERAPGLPPDTAATPLTARVRGFLEGEAAVGGPAAVRTPAGRRVEGTLLRVNPAPGHSFGEPVPELLPIGEELRRRLVGEPTGG